MRHIWIVVLLSCISFAQTAQDTPRAEVFFGYSYLNASTNGLTSRKNLNGGQFSFVGNLNQWVGLEANFSGYYSRFSFTNPDCAPNNIAGIPCTYPVIVRDYTVVFGPRLHYKWAFAHALGGLDHLRGSALGVSETEHSFAGAFGGGVLFPVSKHVGLEGSLDYFVTGHNINPFVGSSTQNDFKAAAGIVFTLGHVGEYVPSTRPNTVPQQTAPQHPSRRTVPAGTISVPNLGVVVASTDNKGARIVDVAPHGIAASAGLHPDDIINSVNGTQVRTPEELSNALSIVASGQKVQLGYLISGQWQSQTTVVVGSH